MIMSLLLSILFVLLDFSFCNFIKFDELSIDVPRTLTKLLLCLALAALLRLIVVRSIVLKVAVAVPLVVVVSMY